MKKNIIALVAGCSGGHLIPGITLARGYKNARILFFTTNHSFDKKIIAQAGVNATIISLPIDTLPSRWYRYPFFALHYAYAVAASLYHLARRRPTRLLVMGGYVSVPVCVAAWLLRIPRDLYELNAVPGKATKMLAPLASTIHVCFRAAQKFFPAGKTDCVTYPIRFADTAKIRVPLDCLPITRTTIFIVGGSQGSRFVNEAFFKLLEQSCVLRASINVIHQTGDHDVNAARALYQRLGIPAIVFDYQHDLLPYYQGADYLVCRAGAGAIFEALFFAKPTILIPLEVAGNDHQLHNARAAATEHAHQFSVVRQAEIKQLGPLLEQAVMCPAQR